MVCRLLIGVHLDPPAICTATLCFVLSPASPLLPTSGLINIPRPKNSNVGNSSSYLVVQVISIFLAVSQMVTSPLRRLTRRRSARSSRTWRRRRRASAPAPAPCRRPGGAPVGHAAFSRRGLGLHKGSPFSTKRGSYQLLNSARQLVLESVLRTLLQGFAGAYWPFVLRWLKAIVL